jgi:hypothetical protein
MSLAALMALSLLPTQPAPQPVAHEATDASAANTAQPASNESEDVPAGAPTDPYGFVGWCYGATDEYLSIYVKVLPDLKTIDKTFGSPVKEDEPYAADIVAEHKALKRFADAMKAAEKASPQPIDAQGQAAIAQGRDIWSKVEAMSNHDLADAWLLWGIPVRCERTAKALKEHPTEVTAIQAPAPPDAAPAPAAQ